MIADPADRVRRGVAARALLCAATVAVVSGALLAGACAGRPEATPEAIDRPTDVSLSACCGDSAMGVALRIASDYREGALASRVYTEEAFWAAALPMAQYAGFPVRTVSTTTAATPSAMRVIAIGHGPDTVLVWSQATDGASTGSMAIADVLRWYANTRAEDRDDALRARLLSGLTVLVAPLVPRTLAPVATVPEMVLSAWRGSSSPGVSSARLVAIGLVEAAGDPTLADSSAATLATSASASARQVGATLATSLRTELPGRLSRSRAPLGDTQHDAVLLSSGALPNDPQQQRLRAVHAAALLTVLDGLATGAYRQANVAVLDRLPASPFR